jgi:hypothetical protein
MKKPEVENLVSDFLESFNMKKSIEHNEDFSRELNGVVYLWLGGERRSLHPFMSPPSKRLSGRIFFVKSYL